jgi:hypothetical protein
MVHPAIVTSLVSKYDSMIEYIEVIMKIAVLYFDINQIGGVLQCITDMTSGFEKLGHTVDTYKLRYTETYKKPVLGRETKEKVLGSNLGIDSQVMWFGETQAISDTLEILNTYDQIIFQRGCPSQNSNAGREAGTSWQKVYKAKPPKYMVVHDPWMFKFYPWQLEVANKLEAICPIHLPSWNTTEDWPGRRVWIPFPVNFDPMKHKRPLVKRQDWVTMLCVWKPWNHPEILLRNMPNINADVRLYGKGLSYYYIAGDQKKRKKTYQNPDGSWLWESVDGESHYHGVIPTEEKWKVFGNSKIIISLASNASWPANTVRVVVEGIVARSDVCTYGDNIGVNDAGDDGLIPNNAVVLFKNKTKIYPKINRVLQNIEEYQEMVDVGREQVMSVFSDTAVCQSWLDLFEGKVDTAIRHNFTKVKRSKNVV